MSDDIRTQCLKIGKPSGKELGTLRNVYGKDYNLRKWMGGADNLYVGRRGRIFIDKEIFHYPESKWNNPYPLSEYSLEESLELYRKHILSSELKNQLGELKGKTLGCFCDQSGDCHAKLLKELYNESK